MLCVYVCRAHHLPTNVVHFVCRDRFYCVTMRRGCAATRDPARVVSQQEEVWSRKVENISFKDFIMQIWIGTVYWLCVV